jgi:hypothetical protein
VKTDDLVTMLAKGGGAVASKGASQRLALAVGWGAFGATLLMAVLLGVRHDLREAAMQPMFWIKVGYPASLALAGLLAVSRLSRPGANLSRTPVALAAPVVFIWILGAIALTVANPAERDQLFFGRTWISCPLLIATLSIPAFVAVTWAAQGLAPTRLRLAGAALGLLSSAIGATIYSLHCPEMSAPFLGVWYLAGMLIPAAIGTLLGQRLLRW